MSIETCQNCRYNEACGEPPENIGYCDIRDKEFLNSTPRPWNCKEFEAWITKERTMNHSKSWWLRDPKMEHKSRVKCIRCGREKLSKIAKPKCPKRFCNGKMVVIREQILEKEQ